MITFVLRGEGAVQRTAHVSMMHDLSVSRKLGYRLKVLIAFEGEGAVSTLERVCRVTGAAHLDTSSAPAAHLDTSSGPALSAATVASDTVCC